MGLMAGFMKQLGLGETITLGFAFSQAVDSGINTTWTMTGDECLLSAQPNNHYNGTAKVCRLWEQSVRLPLG
jgi:hypothetical protein